MNRQQWMAALICVIVSCAPAAAQRGPDLGENDPDENGAAANGVSLSGTTFDVSLFSACGGFVPVVFA